MKIIRILGNRNAGFILGLVCVLNLALGSFVMNMNPGLYPPFFRFDLNYFFSPVQPVHFWLYLLIMTLSVFCGNIFFSTLESLISLVKRGNTGSDNNRFIFRRKIAAIFAHTAIILALIAHLSDGLAGNSSRVQIANFIDESSSGTVLPGLGSIVLDSVEIETYPDGSVKDAVVKARFFQKDGIVKEKTISYNSPAMFNYGMDEIVIQDARKVQGALLLSDGRGNEHRISRERPLKLSSGILYYQGSRESINGLSLAQFSWVPVKGGSEDLFMVTSADVARHNEIRAGGEKLRFKRSVDALMLSALVVHNPSILISAAGAVFMLLGLFFMPGGRRNDF